MKRKSLVQIHIIATLLSVLAVGTFFSSSLIAEVSGDFNFIKTVKQRILFALPLLIIAMPILAITGNQLAGTSRNKNVLVKKRRMKVIMINGILLSSLAVFLYYQSHFQTINDVFLIAQVVELVVGFVNLTLIGLNARAGLMLSGQTFMKNRPSETESAMRPRG